jgi:hypothetical protein
VRTDRYGGTIPPRADSELLTSNASVAFTDVSASALANLNVEIEH